MDGTGRKLVSWFAPPGGPQFSRGALVGLAALLVLALGLTGYTRVAPPTPSLGSALAVLKLIGQMLLAGAVVVALVRLLQTFPNGYLWTLACASAYLYYSFGRNPAWGFVWIASMFVVPSSLLGGSVALLLRADEHSRLSVWLARGAILLSTVFLTFGVVYFTRAGSEVAPPDNAALLSGATVSVIDAPDPAVSGNFSVARAAYGSGTDRHRPEFSEDADWTSEPVDGSVLIEGWEKRSGWARSQYWGFDAEALPLQGRVWYPEGDGPFPLVLIVHGNHSMEDFSDPGYGYLGELLASRGTIFVSVDENFINSSFSGRLDALRGRGLRTENDARGWLLLEHLAAWRKWNETAGHPFAGRVDMSRIGLVGHSRGGEAVAVAASFNRLPHYPDDASLKFDYQFDIRGIVAIAPVDGQYEPSGRGTEIEDVSYFVLHGSHDGDVQSFAGSRQFERVSFSRQSDDFKSSLYIFGANHGQFNTTWGRSDNSFPGKNFLNLRHIMEPESQRQIARVYISAFFEICLNQAREYLPLFEDARTGGDWLPETVYLLHYQDASERVVSRFDEDFDLLTTTLPGGSAKGEGLTVWREQLVELKNGDKNTSAVYLGWDGNSGEPPPSYTLRLPADFALESGESLVFALADANEDPSKKDGDGEPSDSEDEASDEELPIDLTIEIEDGAGRVAKLRLSHVSLLQPQLDVQVRKSKLFNSNETSEPVYQTFRFPLVDFLTVEPELDLSRLAAIRWVFDRTERGVVILDNVAVRSAWPRPLRDQAIEH